MSGFMSGSRGRSLVVVVAVIALVGMSLSAQAQDSFFTMHLGAWAGEDGHPGYMLNSGGAILQEFPHTDSYVHGVAADASGLYISEWGYSPVARYNPASNAWDTVLSLASGVYADGILGATPEKIYADNGYLYVGIQESQDGPGRIAKYTTSGQLVNAALITGLRYPQNMTIKNGLLYVTDRYGNADCGNVGVYTTSGDVVNASLISDPVNWPGYRALEGITVTDDAIYTISDRFDGYIGKFALDGTPIDPQLYMIFGGHDIRADGDSLYAVGGYSGGGWFNKYATDGSSSEGLTDLQSDSQALAIVTPEPFTMSLLALGGLALLRRRPRR